MISNTRRPLRLFIPAAIFILPILAGCATKPPKPISKTEFALDTACTISIYDKVPAGTLEKAFAVLNNVGSRMTIDAPKGELINVNAAAGEHPVKIDPELFHVIQVALHFSRLTDGAFDLTIGPLTKLWGIGTGGKAVPPKAKIEHALKEIDYHNVVLNTEEHTVFLKHSGMVIDLGAVAKGYAGDRVKSYLESAGVKHAIIDLGGNVVTIGSKPDGTPWRIGIQSPERSRGDYVGVLKVTNEAVVSSGQYERYFDYKGKRYGHILSTTTGFPVDNGVTSTTIVTSSSTDADALSTSVFALGVKRGMALINSLKGVEGIILTSDKRVYLSRGIATDFKLADPSYTVEPQISVPSS